MNEKNPANHTHASGYVMDGTTNPAGANPAPDPDAYPDFRLRLRLDRSPICRTRQHVIEHLTEITMLLIAGVDDGMVLDTDGTLVGGFRLNLPEEEDR